MQNPIYYSKINDLIARSRWFTKKNNLREFVSANERHPESVRVFPWLRPAAGDSVLLGIRGIRRKVPNSAFPLLWWRFEPPTKITPNLSLEYGDWCRSLLLWTAKSVTSVWGLVQTRPQIGPPFVSKTTPATI